MELWLMVTQMSMPGDITFDSGTSYWGANLTAFVQNGSIPESRLDNMAMCIVSAWYFLHQDDLLYLTINFSMFNPVDLATNEHINIQANHNEIVWQISAASAVLLKNVDGVLPLNQPCSIVLIGQWKL